MARCRVTGSHGSHAPEKGASPRAAAGARLLGSEPTGKGGSFPEPVQACWRQASSGAELRLPGRARELERHRVPAERGPELGAQDRAVTQLCWAAGQSVRRAVRTWGSAYMGQSVRGAVRTWGSAYVGQCVRGAVRTWGSAYVGQCIRGAVHSCSGERGGVRARRSATRVGAVGWLYTLGPPAQPHPPRGLPPCRNQLCCYRVSLPRWELHWEFKPL